MPKRISPKQLKLEKARKAHQEAVEKLIGPRPTKRVKDPWRQEYVEGLRAGITPLAETAKPIKGVAPVKELPKTYDDPEMQRREAAAQKLAATRALAIKRMYAKPELSHSPSELDNEGDRSIDQF